MPVTSVDALMQQRPDASLETVLDVYEVFASGSLSDEVYIGDFFDSSATMRRYHLVWTDRGDKTDITDPEDDIFSKSY